MKVQLFALAFSAAVLGGCSGGGGTVQTPVVTATATPTSTPTVTPNGITVSPSSTASSPTVISRGTPTTLTATAWYDPAAGTIAVHGLPTATASPAGCVDITFNSLISNVFTFRVSASAAAPASCTATIAFGANVNNVQETGTAYVVVP